MIGLSLTSSSSDFRTRAREAGSSHRFHAHEVAMIIGMDEWTNIDTNTE